MPASVQSWNELLEYCNRLPYYDHRQRVDCVRCYHAYITNAKNGKDELENKRIMMNTLHHLFKGLLHLKIPTIHKRVSSTLRGNSKLDAPRHPC